MTNAELAKYNQGRNVVQVGYASADVWRTIRQFRDILGHRPLAGMHSERRQFPARKAV